MAERVERNVYAIAADITSGIGMGIDVHWQAIEDKQTGIKEYQNKAYSPEPFYGSMLSDEQWQVINSKEGIRKDLSSFERLCTYSAIVALSKLEQELDLDKTGVVLSTTKGNIEYLSQEKEGDLNLHTSAQKIADALKVPNKPIVVSHACISGAVALLYGQRLLQSGRYNNVIVVGCDRFTPFVLNGFQSFQAVAGGPCKPFDKNRTGINLGEAAATIVLSVKSNGKKSAKLLSGATSNDANHISGPSRTGEELYDAINRAINSAGITAHDIDMISAHGTATLYNDEMEAKAINLSGMADVPVHSMKSYSGHTLGAAGVLESAMILESLHHQQLIPSAGYDESGVSVPLNVTQTIEMVEIQYVLKTASGFGGCNAALVWGRG